MSRKLVHQPCGDWQQRTRRKLVIASMIVAAAMIVGPAGPLNPLGAPPARAASGGVMDLTNATPASFTVRPGVELVTVFGAAPAEPLTILDVSGNRLLTLIADDSGQANFGYIPADYLTITTGTHDPFPTTNGTTLRPGQYRIADDSQNPTVASATFTVISVDDHPPQSLYDSQTFTAGFHYITMRDGVQLSAMIRMPSAALYGPGPYPTVVDYSGYSPSNQDSPEPGAMIANLMGFATVGVNMRGSGCSGGVFDIFNPAQSADGYDVIEALAHQPWVLNGKVGMVGLSYPGISQLYVASTQPPHLAAITPLSVIEDPWGVQWPGGIYNKGFTRQWLAQRDASDAPGGTSWVNARIAGGDTTCAAGQPLRKQNPDFEKFGKALEFRPSDADARKLGLLVKKIDVPVYLTGAWQDEQVGSRFATMLGNFTNTNVKKFTMFNGRHPDGFTPLVLSRLIEFLQFYVARQVPKVNSAVRYFAAVSEFEKQFHAKGLRFERDRFASFSSDYAGARAAYEAEPPVRVLFESGAGDPTQPGAPFARYEKTFAAWPPPEATNQTFYFGDDNTLTDVAAPNRSIDRFDFDPGAGEVAYASANAFDFLYPHIDTDWKPLAQGMGLSYLTPPLDGDKVIAGMGHVNLFLRSTATDADLEAMVTEVYPDGKEVWVQNGLLRAGDRTIDPVNTKGNDIEHYFDSAHYQPLPAGEFVNFQIPLNSVAHTLRKGSRLRVTIDTAGRDLPLWAFENPSFGTLPIHDDIARGGAMASSLILPFVNDVVPAAGAPACDSMRGQPCRSFEAITNLTIESDQVAPTTTAVVTTVAPAVEFVATEPADAVAATPAFTG